MNLWITWTLVLCGLYLTVGHSLSKIKLINATDTYEVVENNVTSIRIVNPKPEKPTLREIIYYHLIERPYDDVNQIAKHRDTEDMDDGNMDNGDMDDGDKDDGDMDDRDMDDGDMEDEDLDDRDMVDGDMDDGDIDSVSDETQRPFTNGHGFQFLDSPTEGVSEEDTLLAPKSDERNVSLREEVTTTTENSNTETTTVVEEISTTVPETITYDDMEIEKINTRNQLFDQLRKKYEHQRKHSDSTSRSKREVNMNDIPEAPRLPELTYDSLPDFVREILSTTHKPQSSSNDTNEDEEIRKALEDKLAEMLANLSPFRDEESEEYEQSEETEETTRRASRTYGMNLTTDGGYVWNTLNDPPFVFKVGDDEEPSEEIEDTKDESEVNSSEAINVDNHDNIASEDIFVNITKDKTTQSPVTHKKPDDDKISPNQKSLTLESDEEITKSEEKLTKNSAEKEIDDDHDGEANSEDDDNNGHVRKIDVLVEVLKDERFWKWLAQWTRTYMDLLTKYIRKIAKEEIKKQLIEHPESIADNSIGKSGKPIEADKEILEPSSDSEDSIVIDGRKVPITHKSNIDVNKIDDASDFLRSKKNKTDHKHKPIKHDHLPNSTKNKTKDNAPIAIAAQNIYGFASNSDKVTNVFIFNSNNDTTKFLEGLTLNSVSTTHINKTVDADSKTESSPIEVNTTETANDNRTVVNNSNGKLTAENESVKADDTSKVNVTTTKPIKLDESSSETTESSKTEEDEDKSPSTVKSEEKVKAKAPEKHENEDSKSNETLILNKDNTTETEPESSIENRIEPDVN